MVVLLVVATAYLIELRSYRKYDLYPSVELVVEIKVDVLTALPLTRVSFYNAVPRQTQGDANVSSCGPNLPKQVAVSRDLFFDENGRKHLCGTVVTVITDRGEVFKDYVIYDTMHPRYTNTADILLSTKDESVAFALGITTGLLIISLD